MLKISCVEQPAVEESEATSRCDARICVRSKRQLDAVGQRIFHARNISHIRKLSRRCGNDLRYKCTIAIRSVQMQRCLPSPPNAGYFARCFVHSSGMDAWPHRSKGYMRRSTNRSPRAEGYWMEIASPAHRSRCLWCLLWLLAC